MIYTIAFIYTMIFFFSFIGPDEWETIAPECGNRKQSPINIVTKNTLTDSRLTQVQFTGYQEMINTVIINNGHTGKLSILF